MGSEGEAWSKSEAAG